MLAAIVGGLIVVSGLAGVSQGGVPAQTGVWLVDRRPGPDRRRGDRAPALSVRIGRAIRPPGGTGWRRTNRRAARGALPAHGGGVRRPDERPPDARLARSHLRRAAVSRRGLSAVAPLGGPAGPGSFTSACYPRRPGRQIATAFPGARSHRWRPSNPALPPAPRRSRRDHDGRHGPRRRSRTSTASCPGSSSMPASCSRRATSATPCSSGSSSWPSSPATSTSSSRSGSPASTSRSRPARSPIARRPDPRRADRAARERVLGLVADHSASYLSIRRSLASEGIHLVDYAAIPEHHEALRQRFLDEIFPVLTPLAVDPGHPFPYISTLSLSLAVGVRDPDTGEHRFARVKVPPILPRLLEVEPTRSC